jgi:hypothetical protein
MAHLSSGQRATCGRHLLKASSHHLEKLLQVRSRLPLDRLGSTENVEFPAQRPSTDRNRSYYRTCLNTYDLMTLFRDPPPPGSVQAERPIGWAGILLTGTGMTRWHFASFFESASGGAGMVRFDGLSTALSAGRRALRRVKTRTICGTRYHFGVPSAQRIAGAVGTRSV